MSTLFFGIALICFGLLTLFIIGRRRFSRRAETGLEAFSSYPVAVFVRFIELCFRLIAWLSVLVGTALALLHGSLG